MEYKFLIVDAKNKTTEEQHGQITLAKTPLVRAGIKTFIGLEALLNSRDWRRLRNFGERSRAIAVQSRAIAVQVLELGKTYIDDKRRKVDTIFARSLEQCAKKFYNFIIKL